LLRAVIPVLKVAPRHFVMLATPNRPPRLARRVQRFWPFRLLAGQPGQLLSDPQFYQQLAEPTVPYTIIAGTAGLRGKLSPFGGEPNDWLVAVSETLVRDSDQPLLFPVEHTFMMWSRAVRRAVDQVLAEVAA
jgi:hypothetical protein